MPLQVQQSAQTCTTNMAPLHVRHDEYPIVHQYSTARTPRHCSYTRTSYVIAQKSPPCSCSYTKNTQSGLHFHECICVGVLSSQLFRTLQWSTPFGIHSGASVGVATDRNASTGLFFFSPPSLFATCLNFCRDKGSGSHFPQSTLEAFLFTCTSFFFIFWRVDYYLLYCSVQFFLFFLLFV